MLHFESPPSRFLQQYIGYNSKKNINWKWFYYIVQYSYVIQLVFQFECPKREKIVPTEQNHTTKKKLFFTKMAAMNVQSVHRRKKNISWDRDGCSCNRLYDNVEKNNVYKSIIVIANTFMFLSCYFIPRSSTPVAHCRVQWLVRTFLFCASTVCPPVLFVLYYNHGHLLPNSQSEAHPYK